MMTAAILSVADRLALTLEGLGRAVAAQGGRGVWTAALVLLVWQRVRRVDRQIRGMLARFQAGRVRRVVGPRRGVRGRPRAVAARRLPRRFGWLLELVPGEAACFAGQVRTLIAEPEMAALLAEVPQARRVMGPLCRMLGVEAPGVLSGVAQTGVGKARGAAVRMRRPLAATWGFGGGPPGLLPPSQDHGVQPTRQVQQPGAG